MNIDFVKRNIQEVTERIAVAASGRRVALVAATKTVPADIINAAIDFGITDIGENRVREFVDKRDSVKPVDWHFIGTLQSNKAKYLVGNVSLIQSVNSVKLAGVIDGLAGKLGIVQDVLIEVYAGNEQGKTGLRVEHFDELMQSVRTFKNISVRGIMSIPSKSAPDAEYVALRNCFERYGKLDGFDIFSVGMSGDYERAIGFGSNMVRPGVAIFGQRE